MASEVEKTRDSPGAAAAPHSPAADLGQRLDRIERRHEQDIADLRGALNDLKRELSDLKAVILNRHEDRSVIVLRLNELSKKFDAFERGSLRGVGTRHLLPVVTSVGRLFRKSKRGDAR